MITSTSAEANSLVVQPASYVYDDGDVIGYERREQYSANRNIFVFKKYDDGRYEAVEGNWTVEPEHLVSFKYDKAHENRVYFENMGAGKIKAYIPDTQEIVERSVFVYGLTVNLNNDSNNDEYPSYMNFDPTTAEPDVRFEGSKIFADQITGFGKADGIYTVMDDVPIPQDGYTTEIDIVSYNSDYRLYNVFVIKTKEGYWVKFHIFQPGFFPNGEADFRLAYVIEKDLNATEFAY